MGSAWDAAVESRVRDTYEPVLTLLAICWPTGMEPPRMSNVPLVMSPYFTSGSRPELVPKAIRTSPPVSLRSWSRMPSPSIQTYRGRLMDSLRPRPAENERVGVSNQRSGPNVPEKDSLFSNPPPDQGTSSAKL
jgi:hypothetical protein